MISPTCGSWIGAVTWRMIRHGWRADRSSGGVLGSAARVGAAVEPPAGGALVDLPGADGHRPAQPVGVTAGVLHLVGVRRAVDAAVGHPPGRQPGAAPPPELRRCLGLRRPRLAALARDRCRGRAARAGRRGRWRSPARARRRASPAEPPPSPALASSPVAAPPPSPEPFGSPHRRRARWRRRARRRSRRYLSGGGVEPLEVTVGDPDDPRVQLVERGEVVARRAPRSQTARSGSRTPESRTP